MSLQNQLIQIVKERKEITLDELYKLCDKIGMKHETASRAFRKSRSVIEPIYNKNHKAIIGYRYAQTPENDITACCVWKGINGVHASNCPLYQEMERQARVLEQETERNLRLI